MQIDEYCGTYDLTHVDGKKAPAPASMCLSREGDDVTVFVTVANTLRGKVRVSDDHISGMLMSTMMMGSEEQMQVENLISSGFTTGFAVRRDRNRVVLKNDKTALMFEKTACTQDIFGEHAIVTIDGEAPSEAMTMTFADDGYGGSFVVANVTNSIRGNCRLEGGVLHGEVASTNMETDSAIEVTERKIAVALKAGFRVEKNDTGILLKSEATTIQLCRVIHREDLDGEWLLESVNDHVIPTTGQVSVTFETNPEVDGAVKIFIIVANRIRGSATLYQNVLRSEEPLLSTRVMGTETETQLESAFNAGFQYGLEAVLKGRELTLRDEENTFDLIKVAPVEATNGTPQFKGTYAGKCFKTQGNGLLFRIVDEAANKWAFYNDTTDYRMQVQATFGSRSHIESLDRASMDTTEDGHYVVEVSVGPLATEMFIVGAVNGYKINYKAEPVE